MTRLRDLALLAGAVLLILAWFTWWSPTVALYAARRGAIRARHHTEMAVADLLAVLGCRRAARRFLARIIVRERRRLRAARQRRVGR